jgi:hypothetical protein
MGTGAAVMAKKKSPLKTTPVKIDTGLVRKAKTIAEDKGIDLSAYLSEVVRGAIERDWAKVLKKIVESETGGEP